VAGLTELKSMDVVSDSKRIHALLVGRFSQRKQTAVAYLNSSDGGYAWSEPSFVSAPDAPAAISRHGNDARIAVNGKHMLAIWQSEAALPGTGPMAVAASEDGGATWRAAANPAVGDRLNNQSHMAVAADSAGKFHLTWLDDREENGNTQGLRYASSPDLGRHWGPETTLDAAACTCCWLRLSPLSDRGLALLYRDSQPHDMRLMRLAPGAHGWVDSGPVGRFGWDFDGCPHCGGGLATTRPAGRTVLHGLVWTGKESVAGLYYLRSEGTGHWSAPVKIAGEAARESDVAARPAGPIAVVYTARNASAPEIRVSRNHGRTWSAGIVPTGLKGNALHPRLLATSNGFRAFWAETRDSGGRAWAMAALPL
jgi:hypothetical protein